MNGLITAIITAIMGAIIALLAVTKKYKKDNYVPPLKHTRADKAKDDAEDKSAKVSKEIADESKASIVKRFFDAFSHGPYTDSSAGDRDSTGDKSRGSKGSSKGTGGNGD
jgi:hypothetical protein